MHNVTLISQFTFLLSEKRLVMTKHIVAHTYLEIVFKWALNFSTLAIKRFNSSTKLFQATINTETLQAILFF